MNVRDLGLAGVKEITPDQYPDERGYFCETYSKRRFQEAGLPTHWVQDNQSYSEDAYVLRGLHFQRDPMAQDKLIRVVAGAIFDVAVDIRKGSPSYGQWVGVDISAEAGNLLLVPKGYAHGFLTLQPRTIVAYKVSELYAPDAERAVRFDDPALSIEWPLNGNQPLLSKRDQSARPLDSLDNNFEYVA